MLLISINMVPLLQRKRRMVGLESPFKKKKAWRTTVQAVTSSRVCVCVYARQFLTDIKSRECKVTSQARAIKSALHPLALSCVSAHSGKAKLRRQSCCTRNWSSRWVEWVTCTLVPFYQRQFSFLHFIFFLSSGVEYRVGLAQEIITFVNRIVAKSC